MRRWIGIQSVLGSASQRKAIFTTTCCGFSWCFKVYFARVGLISHRAISLAVSNVLQRLSFRESKQKWQYDLKMCMEGSSCRIIFVWPIPGGVISQCVSMFPLTHSPFLAIVFVWLLVWTLYVGHHQAIICRSSSGHYL